MSTPASALHRGAGGLVLVVEGPSDVMPAVWGLFDLPPPTATAPPAGHVASTGR